MREILRVMTFEPKNYMYVFTMYVKCEVMLVDVQYITVCFLGD